MLYCLLLFFFLFFCLFLFCSFLSIFFHFICLLCFFFLALFFSLFCCLPLPSLFPLLPLFLPSLLCLFFMVFAIVLAQPLSAGHCPQTAHSLKTWSPRKHDQISARGQGGPLTFVTPSSSSLFHKFNLRQCAVRRWPLPVHMCHRSNRQDDRFLLTGNLESCFWNCWNVSTLWCASGLVLLVCVCVSLFVCWVSSVCAALFCSVSS